MRTILPTLTAGLILAVSATAPAAIVGPYTADANTLHLYHFDEMSGTITDTGNHTTLYDLDDNKGTYNDTTHSGFGGSFNIKDGGVNSNQGNYGWASTGTPGGGPQSDWHSATGALTYEAMIATDHSGGEQQILCRDGSSTRGWAMFIYEGDIYFGTGGTPFVSVAPFPPPATMPLPRASGSISPSHTTATRASRTTRTSIGRAWTNSSPRRSADNGNAVCRSLDRVGQLLCRRLANTLSVSARTGGQGR